MLRECVLVGIAGCVVALGWGAGDAGDGGEEDAEGEILGEGEVVMACSRGASREAWSISMAEETGRSNLREFCQLIQDSAPFSLYSCHLARV